MRVRVGAYAGVGSLGPRNSKAPGLVSIECFRPPECILARVDGVLMGRLRARV
jgi:hypothetical protein